MSAGTVGTLAWAARGGSLRRQDYVRLTGQVMLTRLHAWQGNLYMRLRLNPPCAPQVNLSAIILPDSAVAQQASLLASTLSEPWLFNHCMRTYLWGAMLAQVCAIKFDAELLFTASMLHDLGLTATHNCKIAGCSCFAVEGARAAREFATTQGWSQQRSDQLVEAITLHLNVRVGLEQGTEAHLLHAGASLDVIGARARQLDASALAQVHADHPRLSFTTDMKMTLKAQARARPASRAAFLLSLGLVGMLRSAHSAVSTNDDR